MHQISNEHFGLLERLRFSQLLAGRIVQHGHIHAEPRHLRRALNSDGSTTKGILKNWIYDLVEAEPELLHDPGEAEQMVTRALREKMLRAFPGACEW